MGGDGGIGSGDDAADERVGGAKEMDLMGKDSDEGADDRGGNGALRSGSDGFKCGSSDGCCRRKEIGTQKL